MLLAPAGDRLASVAQQIVVAIGRNEKVDPAADARLDRVLRRIWGKGATVARLRRFNGEYLRLPRRGSRGVLYVVRHGDGLGAVMVIEDLSDVQWRRFVAARAAWQEYRPWIGKAWPELDVWVPPRGRSAGEMQAAWALAQSAGVTQVESEGLVWAFLRDRWGQVTCLTVPVTAPGMSRVSWGGAAAAGILFSLGAGGWAWRRVRAGNMVWSIRMQIWMLLLYVTLLPLGSALLLGHATLRDRADRLRHQAFKDGLDRLQRIEGDLVQERQRFLLACRRIRDLAGRHWQKPEKLQRFLRAMRSRDVCEYVDLRAGGGEPMFTTFAPDQPVHLLQKMFSRFAFRLYHGERLAAGPQRLDSIDILCEDLMSSEALGWSTIAGHPDRLHELAMSKTPVEYYWSLYPPAATGPAFIAVIQDRGGLVRRRLTAVVKKQPVGDRLFVMNFMDVVLHPDLPAADRRLLADLLVAGNKTEQPQQWEVRLSSGPAWIVTRPEGLIHRWGLLTARDATATLAALQPWRHRLLLFALVALAIVLMAGFVLAEMVLVPIGDLSRGIESMRLRRVEGLIPVRRDDELGELARVFNRMLGELRELQLARIVQGSLMPRQLPVVGGYTLAARNITASDLGGDYFDCLPLPDGRYLLLIGDATGHGISAALAMAMAKAAVAYSLREGRCEPDQVMGALNHVFNRELKAQRKYMTVLLLGFDPGRHTVVATNAGHHYPVVYRAATGSLDMREMPGVPVGFRARGSWPRVEYRIDPGDAVVLFTDGVTEAETAAGEWLGNLWLETMVRRCGTTHMTAGGMLDELLAEYDRARAPGPLTDDVTVLVLRRQE